MVRKTRANRVRGRRALVWAWALFGLAQIGTSAILDWAWTAVKFRSLTDNLEALRTQRRSPDVICLGSSRMGAAFREDVVRALLRETTGDADLQVFNAAIEGANLPTMDYAMEKLLAAGARPRLVLIEVEPETLATCNRWHRYDIMRMMTWRNLPDYLRESRRSGGFREIVMTRLLPLYYFRRQILQETGRALNLDTSPPNPPLRSGEGGKGGEVPSASPSGVAWTKYMAEKRNDSMPVEERTRIGLTLFQRWLERYEVGGKPAEALDRLVRRCRQSGAGVLLVAVPTSSTHRGLYTPEVDARFLKHLRHAEESLGCRFVDYRDRVPDPYFQDSHHVRLEGGKLFSEELTHEVLLPLWTSTRHATRRGMTKVMPNE